MIPQKFHRIWLGGNAIPEEYEKWWQGWQRQFPSYEFITWNDDDLRPFSTYGQIEGADSPARKADIARLEILYRHGGIYLDCDMMPFHHFDVRSYRSDLVCCAITPGVFGCTSFIAAAPGHEAMKRALDAILAMPDINQDGPHIQTGPHFFGKILGSGDYVNLPDACFYPNGFEEPLAAIWDKDLSKTFGIHVCAGSWASDVQKILKSLQKLLRGDLVDAERMLQFSPDCGSKQEILTLLGDLRAMRRSAAALAQNPILGRRWSSVDVRLFDPYKSGGFLLGEEPGAAVWQIGAGDGLAPPHLRPLLINFDPPAVLVERDPALVRSLRESYAGNANLDVLGADTPDWETLFAGQAEKRPDILSIELPEEALQVIGVLSKNGLKPRIVFIETAGLSRSDRQAIQDQLVNDYHILWDGERISAFRSDFFFLYCEYMFVNFGIPNIFKESLALLNGL